MPRCWTASVQWRFVWFLIFSYLFWNSLVVFLITVPLVRVLEIGCVGSKVLGGTLRSGPAYTHSLLQSLLFIGFHSRQVWYSYPRQHDPNKQREKDIPQTQRIRKGKRTVGGGQLWEIRVKTRERDRERERTHAHEKDPLCNLILAYYTKDETGMSVGWCVSKCMWTVSSCYSNLTQRLAILALHYSAGSKTISHQQSEEWHPVSLALILTQTPALTHTYTHIELSVCYLWQQTEDINVDREGSESVNEAVWLLRRKALSKPCWDKYLLFLCIYWKKRCIWTPLRLRHVMKGVLT